MRSIDGSPGALVVLPHTKAIAYGLFADISAAAPIAPPRHCRAGSACAPPNNFLERGRERFFRARHSRLDGLLIARRAEHYRLFCAYAFTVFVNPATALPAAEVAAAFGAERIFGPDDFP